MKVSIRGKSSAVGQLRGYLLSQGFCLSDRNPHLTIYLEEAVLRRFFGNYAAGGGV